MAPSGNTTSTTTKSTTSRIRTRTRKQRRSQSKKKPRTSKELPTTSAINSGISEMEDMNSDEVLNNECSTPKAERFRIPEISTCPPAPKKPRVASNCLLHRSPISFFAPPELELFFFSALRDISV